MLRHLKESLAELRRGRPGERFRARYRRAWAHRREARVVTGIYIVAGVLLVLLGVVFSFWPVIPGFVFVLAGFGILSARSQWCAKALDRLELALRRRLPRRWRGQGGKPARERRPGEIGK